MLYKNGQLHRDNDLPAVIRSDGTQYWYKNGRLHRDCDLPASIYSDGTHETQRWYNNGKCHRDGDLPAIIEIIENDNNIKSYMGTYFINGVETHKSKLDEETYNICKYDLNRPQSSQHMVINIDIETI